jgi:Ca-activated chloride channel family protein
MRALLVSIGSVVLLLVTQVGTPAPDLVTGTVVDASGKSLPGAAVDLLIAGRVVHAATTDAGGAFRIERVQPGTYQLRVSLAAFVPFTRDVTIAGTAVPALRITLTPGTVQEARAVADQGAAQKMPQPMAPPAIRAATLASPAAAAITVHGGVGPGWRVPPGFNTEAYDRVDENGYRRVSDHPLSTFSIDVDTASYANVRRFLGEGRLPPADAVRTEELINYFRFTYPAPKPQEPFSVATEVAACPWNPRHRLALVGLRAPAIAAGRTPPRNLVFLLDVSGSMDSPDKLPLVQTAMRMLADTLTPADRVAIVVYAGASGLALPSTSGGRHDEIRRAIDELRPGGSTNGAEGIKLAYDTAAAHFIKDGINRVILATDGDFNVGVTSQGELTRLIEQQRERGIFLSVLGVGTGNLKDSTMEKLADRGNGNYAYLDSVHEARRVLVAEAGATLVTVAKDVKIQVEFNPRVVGAYRLIGYENRLLAKEDFNDDRKDAGEMGAGHTVTALYEIVPPSESSTAPSVDPLKYQPPAAAAVKGSASDELMTVKVRYKAPQGDTSKLMSFPVADRTGELSGNIGFAAAVAEFGMLLRGSEFKGSATWDSARELARRYRGEDPEGYRAEFARLVDLAGALTTRHTSDQTRRR